MVTVQTKRANDHVQVEIIDTGSGILETVQFRMFERFFTTKGAVQGTGLGLHIAYRIVADRQGGLQVQSQPGKTRFQIRLPFNQLK